MFDGKPSARLGYALLFASLLHAFVIFEVSFVPTPKPVSRPEPVPGLRVILNHPHPQSVESTEVTPLVAETSLEETNPQELSSAPPPTATAATAPQLLPSTTMPASKQPPAPAQQAESPPQPERLHTRHHVSHAVLPEMPRPSRETAASPPEPTKPKTRRPTHASSHSEPNPGVNAADLLAGMEAEIARITSDLDRRANDYAQRLRRRSVSTGTTEYKYAAYLEAWRRKVERIGNLNYPEQARRQRLHGNLVLRVTVRANGSIQEVQVTHSSGYPLLDAAAIRIVRLAAPFAPFPPSIRKEVDILDITRTWQFLSSNQLR